MGQDPNASTPCWLNWKMIQSHSKHVLQNTMECSTAIRIKHRRERAINKKGQEVKKRNKWQQDLAFGYCSKPCEPCLHTVVLHCPRHPAPAVPVSFSPSLSIQTRAARGTAWLGAPCLQRELMLAPPACHRPPGMCSLSLHGTGS